MKNTTLMTDKQIWIPSVKTYIAVLKAEIEHLKSKLEPTEMGHIHTTISTLQHRVKELEKG